MSENVAEAEAVTAPAEEVTEEVAPKPSETLEFWKAQSRKQEAKAKANADAAKRLQALEDASKSESEKVNERLTAAESRAAKAEARALRLEVAHAKGLSATQAKRLVGDTIEELESDADDLLESFKPAEKPATSRRPQELRGGTRPEEQPEETDPGKLAQLIMSRGR
jgi:hypothetical protein